jgi:hypothetical protein
MVDSTVMVYASNFTLFRKWWKISRKRTHGYDKSYIAKTPEGDTLRVEFNHKEDIVKLSIQEASDKKKEYISIVKKGTSIREKEVSSNANSSFKRKLYRFKDVFSSLPDDDILESLAGIYNLSLVSRGVEETDLTSDSSGEFSTKQSIPGETFFQRLKRYAFPPSSKNKSFLKTLKERAWCETADLILGASASFFVYYYYYDYVILGLALAALGFFFGALDWIIRNRDPLLLKVLLFSCVGSYYFYTGYTLQ